MPEPRLPAEAEEWHRLLDLLEEAKKVADGIDGSIAAELHGVIVEVERAFGMHVFRWEREARRG